MRLFRKNMPKFTRISTKNVSTKPLLKPLTNCKKKYPENAIPDKIEALKIIANARLHKKQEKLAEDLEAFFRKYPDSKIIQHFKKIGELKKE